MVTVAVALGLHGAVSHSSARQGVEPAASQTESSTAGEMRRASDRLNRGDFREAADVFRHVTEVQPELAGAHVGLGIALANLGRSTEAIASFKRAVALQPNLEAAHLNLGIAYLQLNEIASAREAFRNA